MEYQQPQGQAPTEHLLQTNPQHTGGRNYLSHFREEKTEAQKGLVTCIEWLGGN